MIAIYHCQHTKEYVKPVPRPGDYVYCLLCESGVVVTEVSGQYQIKCDHCQYGRAYGQAKTTAETRAASHAIKRRHRVRIMHGNEILGTVDPIKRQEPLDSGDPPF